jgi:hypothetical protein
MTAFWGLATTLIRCGKEKPATGAVCPGTLPRSEARTKCFASLAVPAGRSRSQMASSNAYLGMADSPQTSLRHLTILASQSCQVQGFAVISIA